jgi:hypothetical protein
MIRRLIGIALLTLLMGASDWDHSVPVVVEYQTEARSTTDTSSPSYASQAIGTANGNRRVVVAAFCDDDTGASPDITALTVDGISASEQVEFNQAAQAHSIWQAIVPTNTSVTIAFTASVTCERTAIAVWAVYYAKYSGQYAQGTGTGTNLSIALDEATIPPGSVGIWYYINALGTAGQFDTTVTFSGMTERFDAAVEAAARASGADGTFNPPTTPAPTFSMTNPSAGRSVAVIFW